MSMTTSSVPATLSRVPVRRTTVSVNGRDVDLLTVGVSTDQPLLFLHGFGANPRIYLRSLCELARRGRYVIAPALPSFGRSEPLPVRRQNVGGVAAHIVAFLEQRFSTMGAVDVVGHSFGGGVALRVGATRPDLVRSLTLICPVGGAGRGASSAPAVVHGLLWGDAGDQWVRNGVRHFLPAFVRHAPEVLAAGLSAWTSNQIDDVAAVDAHGLPVRFVFATHDELVRPGDIPALVSENIHVEFEEGRHSWLIGESVRFADVVLSGQSSPRALPPGPSARPSRVRTTRTSVA